jgi:uncharacterized membrane protein
MKTFQKLQRILTSLRAGLAILAVWLALTNAATACPNCKEGMNSKDPQKTNIAKGYYYSILLMMGTPPTILTAWGLAMYQAVRKARRNAKEAEETAGEKSI